ncbi:NAD-dependent epimerase/dehydratase family protein, partial [Brachyspira pilosicoli]|uniref:NAD-dependent epimerase/dehydratase family protein n=1 Tax=Brachyspira pilosicoli TaxID=52584 RepID=UPI0012F4BA10
MKKIYIAGHRGLVGSAIDRMLTKKGYSNIIRKTHSELDLRNREDVFKFFEKEKPEWVFLSAAKVGGIYANNTYPVDFLLYNLQIQNNIIEASYTYGVEKLMFLGSSCIYPKECPQPIKEEYLLSGYLESTNRHYALAKITGIELCEAYNRQY